MNVHVYTKHCSACGNKEHYQGVTDAIFNLNNTHLYSFELLHSYLDQQLDIASPFYDFWRTRLSGYSRLGISGATLKRWRNLRNEFQKAVLDFIMLMQIDYSRSLDCPCHGAEGIVVDGFNMSVNKEKLKQFETVPWQADSNNPPIMGSLYVDRQFFQTYTRRLIFRLCDHRSAKESGLTLDEYKELQEMLAIQEAGAFKHLFVLFPSVPHNVNDKDQDLLYADRRIRDFLRAISAPVSPSCRLLPFRTIEIICRLRQQRTLCFEDQHMLARHAPVLLQFIQAVLDLSIQREWPASLLQMLIVLEQKTRATYSMIYDADRDAPEDLVLEHYDDTNEMLQTLYCYPSRRPIRRLRRYQVSKSATHRQQSVCTKRTSYSNTRGPGCFFVYCLQHRVCLGFHMLRNHESPQTIFEVLFTRFKTPPKVLVYDNGCNASEFILNREPNFFKEMRIVIDGLHFHNHVNCSKVFDIRQYPEYQNSAAVLAEIRNAKLRNLKGHLLFANTNNFMVITRYFVHRLNGRELERQITR